MGVICVTKFNRTILRCVAFKRTMLCNVLTAKAISHALLSSYLTSKTSTPLRPLRYNFVMELIHLLCHVFANYTFWHKKYELSLTIDIGLLHIYNLSVLPPKQHKILLIVSRQISIANVSPNLTDAHIHSKLVCVCFFMNT